LTRTVPITLAIVRIPIESLSEIILEGLDTPNAK
jgi:hypothetical protein